MIRQSLIVSTVCLGLMVGTGCGKPGGENAGESPAPPTAVAPASTELEAAVDLHEAGELEGAIAAYTAILAADPTVLDARVNRGLAYLESEQASEAWADFDTAVKAAPTDPELLALRGDAAAAGADYAAAVADYDASLELEADQPEVHVHRGMVWAAVDEYDAAVVDYSFAINLDPDLLEAYELRQGILESFDDAEAAAAVNARMIALTKTLADTPEDTEARIERAGLLFDTDAVEGCAIDLGAILEQQPDHARAILLRGHVRMVSDQSELAIDDYTALIARAEDVPREAADAHVARSLVYATIGADARARDDLLAAATLMPDDPETHRLLGWMLSTTADTDLRDPSLALTHATKAVELADADLWLYRDTLAAAQAASGDFAAAQATIASAIKDAPEGMAEELRARQKLYATSIPYSQE